MLKILCVERKKFDLEDRLVDYACRMIDVVEALPKTRGGNYIAGQLINPANLQPLIMVRFRLLNQEAILSIKWE